VRELEQALWDAWDGADGTEEEGRRRGGFIDDLLESVVCDPEMSAGKKKRMKSRTLCRYLRAKKPTITYLTLASGEFALIRPLIAMKVLVVFRTGPRVFQLSDRLQL
jgi:hypothetical protein